MKSTLLPTKLQPPSLPANRVRRDHLEEWLNNGLLCHRQITLVSAPAGFGKTICICDWVNTLDRWPITWLSLESSDDDPGQFFAYFIAALQKVRTDLGREIEAVIRAGQLPPSEIITTSLISDILESDDRFLLILDDFHVIQDQFILQVLEKLVVSLPQPLYLVIITREDPPLPLAQIRANNLLTEVRARDLSFRTEDTQRFMEKVMGLSLSPTDIAKLEEKTEGWIVGLQLAAIAIQSPLSGQGQVDPSRFISTLSGNHRYILNYLTEQVLNQQPEDIRLFLLQTAILDRLNGDLCDAVTERSDSRVLLERLLNSNLFLIPLDDEGKWYRYHRLFSDLLRDLQYLLPQNEITALHRRASCWCAQEGLTSEAMQHALQATDYAMAVNLLEKHAMEMIMLGFVKTVNNWVQAIPVEWTSQSPRTHLAFAWMHILRGAYSQISPYLEQLKGMFENPPGESQLSDEYLSLKSEWMVMQSLALYMQGKIKDCMNMATRALETTHMQDNHVRSLAYYVQASVYWVMEDYPRAVETYQKSIQQSRVTKNLVAEMMSTVGLAGMLLELGQLNLTFEIASQAVDRIERSDVLPPISAVVYAGLGDAHYQWYQIEDARRCFRRALHLSTLGGSNTVTILCHVLLSRSFHIEGNLEAAVSEIRKAVDLMPLEAPDYVWQEVTVQQVRIYLAQDRLAAAQMTLQRRGFSFQEKFSFPALPEGSGIKYADGLMYNSSLKVLLNQPRRATRTATNQMESGLALADNLIARAYQSQQLLIVLEALLLRAQIHTQLGNHPESRIDYLRALELAEPEGFIGIFVEQNHAITEALANLSQQNQLGTARFEYAKRILDAFTQSRSRSTPQRGHSVLDLTAETETARGTKTAVLVEPLTEREVDVLRLMAEGLKYREIAERLFISLNTVRFHVKAIYGKLNVSKRMKAIEVARQRGLL